MTVEELKIEDQLNTEQKTKFTETIDALKNIPTLTINEAKSLTKEELGSIYVHCEDNIVRINENEHFSVIKYKGKNRKLYRTLGKSLKDNRTYISADTGEGDVSIGIGAKVGNSITGVYSDTITRNGKCWVAQNIHKGNLKYVNGGFLPKK